MGLPNVRFLIYEAAGSAEYTEITAGGVYTTGVITANAYRKAVAMRVELVSDSTFHLDNLKIWANDTLASINGSTQDLGENYAPTATPGWWSMVYIYTANGGAMVDDPAMQTASLVCPTAVFADGSAGQASLPAIFRGDTKNDGYDMLSGAASGLDSKQITSTGQWVAYSKPLGISFHPNLSAQYGHYTDFSVRVEFDFS